MPGPNPQHPSGAALALASGLVAVLTVLAFGPALGGEFLNWDDWMHVRDNPRFRGLDAERLAWMFRTSFMGPYQPLAWASLALDHALWSGDPTEAGPARGYHLTAVLLHALTAVVFLHLARRLFVRAGLAGAAGRPGLAAAVLAALLFAVHPLRAESVAWITERRDVLSGLFVALASLAWLRWVPSSGRARRPSVRAGGVLAAAAACALFFGAVDRSGVELAWGAAGPLGLVLALAALAASALLILRGTDGDGPPWTYAAALACFLLALLSKGLALTLPAVWLVLDLWPLRRRQSGLLALVAEKAPFLACSVAFAALAVWGQANQQTAMMGLGRHGLVERVLQVLHSLFFYPWKTAVPLGLGPLVELPRQLSLAEPRFAIAAAVVVLSLFLLVALRRRAPAAAAAFAAFALMILPVCGATQSGAQLVADRYSHLACMPFALALAGGLLAWAGASPRAGRAALGLALAAVVALGLLTARQAGFWRTSETLWERAVAVDPGGSYANQQLGALRYQAALQAGGEEREGLLVESQRLFVTSLEARPNPKTRSYLVEVLLALDDLGPAPDELRAALELTTANLERAQRRGAVFSGDLLNHGRILLRLGRPAEALPALTRYAKLRPDDPVGARLLAQARSAQ